MGIGFSIFLLALGAVLTFAVHASVAGLDLQIVGWILMAAGALGLVLTMVVFAPRRNRASLAAGPDLSRPVRPVDAPAPNAAGYREQARPQDQELL